MSELLNAIQLPNGDQVKKIRRPDNSVAYHYSGNNGDKYEPGEFMRKDVGEALERNANSVTNRQNEIQPRQAQFSVTPKDETERETMLMQRYPKMEETEGLHPQKNIGSSKWEDNIRAWMDNNSVDKQVENDPLLRNKKEKRRAKEARARQIAEDLRNAENEGEAKRILRDYGVESA